MGIINRLLLFVSMIGVAALAALMLVLSLGGLPDSVWLNEIHYILSRRETVLISALVLLLALHMIAVSLRGRGGSVRESGEFLLLQGAEGGVRVALPAVRSLAETTLLSLRGIRMAKVRVQRVRPSKKEQETLKLVLDLTVSPGTPVAPLAEAARAALTDELREVLGLEHVAVEPRITAITAALPEGKRRVV